MGAIVRWQCRRGARPACMSLTGVARGACSPRRLPPTRVCLGTASRGAPAVMDSVSTILCASATSEASPAPSGRWPGEPKGRAHGPVRHTGHRALTPPGGGNTGRLVMIVSVAAAAVAYPAGARCRLSRCGGAWKKRRLLRVDGVSCGQLAEWGAQPGRCIRRVTLRPEGWTGGGLLPRRWVWRRTRGRGAISHVG